MYLKYFWHLCPRQIIHLQVAGFVLHKVTYLFSAVLLKVWTMGYGTGPTVTVVCFNPGSRLKEKLEDATLNHWQHTTVHLSTFTPPLCVEIGYRWIDLADKIRFCPLLPVLLLLPEKKLTLHTLLGCKTHDLEYNPQQISPGTQL